MLERAGYELARIRGSHHVFTKEGESPFTIAVHRGKVKYGYVRSFKKIIEGAKPPKEDKPQTESKERRGQK